jgi:hypothetical protein
MIFTNPQAITSQRMQLIYLIIIAIFLIVALIGGIGWLFERLISKYGDQVNTDTWKIVQTRVVSTPKQFKRIAFKKSHRRAFIDFFWVTFVFGVDALILFGYMRLADDPTLINDLFDYSTRGFNTIFPIFDWANIPMSDFFGIQIISNFPTLLNVPRFVPEAIVSYIIFLISVLGIFLTIRATLSLYGRTLRIMNKANTLFTKNLDEVAKTL